MIMRKYNMETRKLMFGIFGMIILLGVINGVLAIDGYCFVRLGNGQSIPAEIVSSTTHMSCDGTRCSVHGFSSETSFLQVCTDSRGYYASYTSCDKLCSGSGIINTSVQELNFQSVFPFNDGGVFTKQTFFMDLSTNKISAMTLIDNVAGTQRTLCPNCVSYKKPMNFKQGFNDITVRAVRGAEIKERRITFFIDNLKPRVTKTMPLQNKFANGDFIVSYDEYNVQKIELFYGITGNVLQQESTSCPDGKAQSCLFNADLSVYDGKQIEYWFNIVDVANNAVLSKKVKVFVDRTMPVVNSLNYSIKGTYLTINMNVTEKNMDKIIYYDNDDPKARILCTGLNKGICSKKLALKSGHHIFDLQTRDKAGNVVSNVIEFDI